MQHDRVPAPGTLIWIRNQRWRIERTRQDRHVVRLDVSNRQRRLTVLAPFDRPVATTGNTRAQRVRRQRAVARIAGVLSQATSALSLGCARRLKACAPRRHTNRPCRAAPAAMRRLRTLPRETRPPQRRRVRTGRAAPLERRASQGSRCAAPTAPAKRSGLTGRAFAAPDAASNAGLQPGAATVQCQMTVEVSLQRTRSQCASNGSNTALAQASNASQPSPIGSGRPRSARR